MICSTEGSAWVYRFCLSCVSWALYICSSPFVRVFEHFFKCFLSTSFLKNRFWQNLHSYGLKQYRFNTRATSWYKFIKLWKIFWVFIDLHIIVMASIVILAVCVVVKSLSASIQTLERHLSCMNPHVNLQIRSIFKSFTATRMRA